MSEPGGEDPLPSEGAPAAEDSGEEEPPASPLPTDEEKDAKPSDQPPASLKDDEDAKGMLQKFEEEDRSEEVYECPPPLDLAPVTSALKEMQAAVLRSELSSTFMALAQQDAAANDDDDEAWAAALPPLPLLPAAPAGSDGNGNAPASHSFVCMDDGCVVEAHELLAGPRKGAPYLSLPEADAQCRSALENGAHELRARLQAARSQAAAAAAVPAVWAGWMSQAHEATDAGFDELQRALDMQRSAARQQVQQMRDEAEKAAARTVASARACWRTATLQLRTLDSYAAVGADAPSGAIARGWVELRRQTAALHEEAGAMAPSDEASLGLAVASAAISDAIAEDSGVSDALRLPLVGPTADLPPHCLTPPGSTFDASAQLALLCSTFGAPQSMPVGATASGPAASAHSGGRGGRGGPAPATAGLEALVSSQREAIEKLNRLVHEQRAATALLQDQLDEAQRDLATARAGGGGDANHNGGRHPQPEASASAGSVLARLAARDQRVINVFSQAGVRVDYTYALDPSPGGPEPAAATASSAAAARLAVVATVHNGASQPLSAVQLLLAVPKYLKVVMAERPERRIAAGGSAQWPFFLVQQPDQPASAPVSERPFKVKCRLQHGSPPKHWDIISPVLQPPEGPAAAAPPPTAALPLPTAALPLRTLPRCHLRQSPRQPCLRRPPSLHRRPHRRQLRPISCRRRGRLLARRLPPTALPISPPRRTASRTFRLPSAARTSPLPSRRLPRWPRPRQAEGRRCPPPLRRLRRRRRRRHRRQRRSRRPLLRIWGRPTRLGVPRARHSSPPLRAWCRSPRSPPAFFPAARSRRCRDCAAAAGRLRHASRLRATCSTTRLARPRPLAVSLVWGHPPRGGTRAGTSGEGTRPAESQWTRAAAAAERRPRHPRHPRPRATIPTCRSPPTSSRRRWASRLARKASETSSRSLSPTTSRP